jgi:hypothetical protein
MTCLLPRYTLALYQVWYSYLTVRVNIYTSLGLCYIYIYIYIYIYFIQTADLDSTDSSIFDTSQLHSVYGYGTYRHQKKTCSCTEFRAVTVGPATR